MTTEAVSKLAALLSTGTSCWLSFPFGIYFGSLRVGTQESGYEMELYLPRVNVSWNTFTKKIINSPLFLSLFFAVPLQRCLCSEQAKHGDCRATWQDV